VAGTALKLFWNGALAAYAYDSSITGAGTVGLRVSSGVTVDDFVGEQITQTTPTPLFTEDFSTPVNKRRLSRNWAERVGNVTDNGSTLIAADPSVISIATIHGVSLSDSAVQADVTLGNNQIGSLVARYASTGTYYTAVMVANATHTASTAYLFKFVNGVATQLGSPVALSSVKGTMRLEVVGNELKFFYTPDAGTQ